MATYAPPSETLTLFNPDVFLTNDAGDFLTFPVAQGAEVFPFGLSTTSASVVGTLTTVDIEPSSASTALDIAGTQVGGALTIGNENTRSGAISIGSGASSKAITIGGTSGGTTTINGGTINIAGSGGSTTTISNTGILSLQNGSGSALNIGSNKTGGTIDIGQNGASSSTTTINIGVGSNQSGGINIGTGNITGSLPITIGNQTGAFGSVDIGTTSVTVGKSNTSTNNVQTSTSGTLNLKTTSTGGAINMGTGMTSGSVVIGGSSTNTVTIQRPILLLSASDPASATTAIGYILPNVTSTSGAIALPVNSYTWSTGARSLGVGVWMLSLGIEITTAGGVVSFRYNYGFMNSAPVTGDSATASSAPTNTISGVNGNVAFNDNTTLDNSNYAYSVGGVVLNNYAGTYNNVYGIFNADWTTAGTVTMDGIVIRAVRIG